LDGGQPVEFVIPVYDVRTQGSCHLNRASASIGIGMGNVIKMLSKYLTSADLVSIHIISRPLYLKSFFINNNYPFF
jgi:hypothetical protein